MRAGPRNKPSAGEREEHEKTHMPFRNWCTHCMMGRGRTHHHVSMKRSEELSRRPIIAMDYHFLEPNSTANSQTIPDESVTCIAVKEARHQNIMSSVAFKKGIEKPWASERVARFINSLGYKEITLKRDTENCNAEVTLDAIKGEKPSNGLVENAVMLLRGVIRSIKCFVEGCTQKEIREDSPILSWLVEHVRSILSGCQKGRDGRTPFERLHGKKPTQEFAIRREGVIL